jgi:alpha-tubulin suppressor-like RCC1 family protein
MIVALAALRVVQIAAGNTFTCAVHEDGAVSCWGDVFGDRPVHLDGLDDVVQVAGAERPCALRRDGTISCVDWGGRPVRVEGVAQAVEISRGCARLRDGHVTCWAPDSAPAIVAGLDDATHIEGDATGGCAVRRDGTVACWREGTAATPLAPLTSVVEVTEGCARHASGALSCWGNNRVGELGRGVYDDHPPRKKPDDFFPPDRVVGIDDAVQVSRNFRSACALTKDGRVMCWGLGLRSPEAASRERAARPMQVKGVPPAKQVSVGGFHVCVLDTDGRVWCWGNDAHGQLGDGWSSVRAVPLRVPGIDDAVAVWAGSLLSCAVRRAGTVSCWGRGDATPRMVAGLTDVVQLAGRHELCARDQRGVVRCGDERAVRKVVSIAPAVDVSVGLGFGCAVLRDGHAACWGDNNKGGQLGTGHRELDDHDHAPSPVLELDDALEARAGVWASCFRRRGGRVTCFGLIQGETTIDTKLPSPPIAVNIADLEQLAVGDGHACGLKAGRVWCWPPVGAPVRNELIDDAVVLAMGDETTCVVRRDGRVACWGRADRGQLGDGFTPRRQPLPVQPVGVTDAVGVSVGGDHACAVLRDGGVMCWGEAGAGEVGTRVGAESLTPAVVSF